MSAAVLIALLSVLLLGLKIVAQTEMKKVVGQNATLPCHHRFWDGDDPTLDPTLDIEWLFLKPAIRQRVVITYFAGRVFDPDEAERGRLAFAGDFLRGDASLLIGRLLLSDSGEYSCKVKTREQYHWSSVSLTVLVKPSRPRCWVEGRPLEGGDVKMSCRSAEGSGPIQYKWDRVLDQGRYLGKLPELALVDLKNPEIVTLKNLSRENQGFYRCTATNAVGRESCSVELHLHHVRTLGVAAGAAVGVSLGFFLIVFIIWCVCRRKEKKYDEDEAPNEIREDAEAPKAKLVKPTSLSSSRSASSRSGTSSTQSMMHHLSRGPRGGVPAVSALRTNHKASTFPQPPPGYDQTPPKTPGSRSPPSSSSASTCKPSPPPPLGPGNRTRLGAAMGPAQTRAFQTV